MPEITEAQQKALQELKSIQQQAESKKGTKKKLDAEVVDLQRDVATLTGQKQTLTTQIEDLQSNRGRENSIPQSQSRFRKTQW